LKGTSDAEAYRVEELGAGQLTYMLFCLYLLCKTETFIG